MNIKTFQETVGRLSDRMIGLFLHDILGKEDGEPVLLGLPAGATHLKGQKLIIAATVCDAPMFRDAIEKAAAATGADVLVIHHGFHPETLNNVFVSALVHMSGRPYLLEKMSLYFHPADGYWLVPHGPGPFIAFEQDGLRVSFTGPYMTLYQRAEGMCEAANIIVRRTRNLGAL